MGFIVEIRLIISGATRRRAVAPAGDGSLLGLVVITACAASDSVARGRSGAGWAIFFPMSGACRLTSADGDYGRPAVQTCSPPCTSSPFR